MTAKGGRPRTFPPGAVELALVERDRTGRTWVEIARRLNVHPGTLQARASEFRRVSRVYKTPDAPLDDRGSILRSYRPPEGTTDLELGRDPRLCSVCGLVHSPGVPCP